jgi:nicotinamide-nucleotide amidase
MPSVSVQTCAKTIAGRGLTIAFAESATAGRAAFEFASTPESGKILPGALVCYDATLKENLLDVPAELVERCTPESPEVTAEIARRLKKLIPADILVGITGLTTPGGSETPEKPVGTMFVHIAWHDREFSFRKVFPGSPEEIVLAAIDSLAELISERLNERN